MSIQTKIALIFTLVCTIIVVALSSAVFYFSYERAFQDFYTRLELRATIAAKANLDTGQNDTKAYDEIRNEHLRRLPEEREYIIRVDTLQRFKNSAAGQRLPESFFNNIATAKSASFRSDYRFYMGIHYQVKDNDYIIILTAVNTYARNFLNSLKTILFIATLLSVVLIFTASLFFSQQILAPIRRITSEVNNIGATSLHNRLLVKEGKDDITELANTFNNMLSRLETSFETQNNFVSNASHELNTPLAAIMGEAEFSLARQRSPEQYVQSMQVILLQAEKLRSITRSLLELAQSGFTGSLAFTEINVPDLLEDVQQVASGIYPDCRLVIDYSLYPNFDTLSIKGHFHLLELCISNIVLNACKYSNGQEVTLAVASSDQHVIFIIRDKGIGIPERDMPHIFDPFFRASNVRGAKGYGIGLPLAQNIIKLHRGIIQIASRESQGTEVVVKFPR